jgi:hypothetical protein
LRQLQVQDYPGAALVEVRDMGRPKKQTVDYFPHVCRHGRTMAIIEQKFGNDGYAFWFKLLELLGDTEGHFLDCRNAITWEYLQSKTRLEEDYCNAILDLLAKLEAIDPELWSQRIIWSENFLKNIATVYQNRRVEIPSRPNNYTPKSGGSSISTQGNGNSTDEKPQSKEEKSRVTPSPRKRGESRAVGENPRAQGTNPRAQGTNPRAQDNGYDPDFETWWEEYPERRKTGKPKVYQKWQALKKIKKLLPLDGMLAVLRAQKQSPDWTKDGGDYISGPHKYLNQFQFLDESIKPQTRADPDCPVCGGKGREFYVEDGENLVRDCPCLRRMHGNSA